MIISHCCTSRGNEDFQICPCLQGNEQYSLWTLCSWEWRCFWERARHVFNRFCNLITQSSGQSGSAIAYFWKSRLSVTLAAITFENTLKWAKGHNQSCNPDSVTWTTLTTTRRSRREWEIAMDWFAYTTVPIVETTRMQRRSPPPPKSWKKTKTKFSIA